MKTILLLFLTIPLSSIAGNVSGEGNPTGYVLGGILSVLLLAYLVFSLIKPEKF